MLLMSALLLKSYQQHLENLCLPFVKHLNLSFLDHLNSSNLQSQLLLRFSSVLSRMSPPFSHELAEDVLKDAAILEESDLWVSVETASSCERLASAGSDSHVLVDRQVAALEVNGESLRAVKTVSIGALTILELERQDAHADQVASVDTLVALSDHSVDTLKVGALGSPITGGARAVLVSSEDNQLFASILVLLGGIEDGHLLTRWDVHSCGANLWDHLVDETHVGEGATSHDLVISSAGAVRVEVLGGNAALLEVTGGRGVLSDLTSRGDVISSDRVTDVKEAVSAIDAVDRGDISLSLLEERWVVDVGGGIVPLVELARWSIKVLPHVRAIKNGVVSLLEHLRGDDRVGHGGDLLT